MELKNFNSNTGISVIISTYNAEEWLEKVIWSYHAQSFKNFEMIIADDGSKHPTFELIDKLKAQVHFPITHVWHKDDGFQKSMILNKAITACNSHYILMSDGDCLAREDFLKIHNDHREEGYFLSGGYYKLPMSISKAITKEDIVSQKCFQLPWLKSKGLQGSFKNNKLTARGLKAKLLNLITPTNASWNGHNSSGWKSDILKVNGFDERMQYGGQDRELGERLFNLGLKSKQIRYSAVCLHLDHKRGYKNQESIDKNRRIRQTTRSERRQWTDYGIVKKEG
ncbi:glycosyltransferase family 2 protein [Winogradskyella sp. A3E31]|uniref:glycosyltransferase family 2 protein n=1 Tax=Winogradskyella sp. A3E31 TaxID=3349637 RepID=UPI00398B2622